MMEIRASGGVIANNLMLLERFLQIPPTLHPERLPPLEPGDLVSELGKCVSLFSQAPSVSLHMLAHHREG